MRISAPAAFARIRLAPFEAGTDHADIRAGCLRPHQAGPFRGRHAHHVGIGAQRDAWPPGESDSVIDPPHREHADRATGTVDHAQIGRQQVLDAIARDRVGVAAAELHERIAALRLHFSGDRRGKVAGERAVTVFIDIFHACRSAAVPEYSAAASASSAKVRSASTGSIFAKAWPTWTMT